VHFGSEVRGVKGCPCKRPSLTNSRAMKSSSWKEGVPAFRASPNAVGFTPPEMNLDMDREKLPIKKDIAG